MQNKNEIKFSLRGERQAKGSLPKGRPPKKKSKLRDIGPKGREGSEKSSLNIIYIFGIVVPSL